MSQRGFSLNLPFVATDVRMRTSLRVMRLFPDLVVENDAAFVNLMLRQVHVRLMKNGIEKSDSISD